MFNDENDSENFASPVKMVVFGFFSDILGQVFFPKDQSEDLSVMESFAVFGCAFIMRPLGGLIIGYIGDKSGRKKALEISIFLMAFATICMGSLPTYDQVGGAAILLLLAVRMLQGLSVGGQLMSSLVFTVESHPHANWGFYGSCVMAAGNVGTLLGGLVAYGLRSSLTEEQLLRWGWRLPFLSGTLIVICGIYLKYFCQDDEILPGHSPIPTTEQDTEVYESEAPQEDKMHLHLECDENHKVNPLRMAFSRENRRSMLSSAMIPMLWSGGFYLTFVWMVIYMEDIVVPPVASAFAVNSVSLLILCILFPIAGTLSDWFGRRRVMTIGGVTYGILGPLFVQKIGEVGGGDGWELPFVLQTILGLALALFGAPMCAWLVEAFEPEARLTSVAIGYNVAQALAGGLSPFLATFLADDIGPGAPGIMLFGLSFIALTGLWCVASPRKPRIDTTVELSGTTGSIT